MRQLIPKPGISFWTCSADGGKFIYTEYVVKSIRTGKGWMGAKRRYASLVQVVPKVTMKYGKFVKNIPRRYFHSITLDNDGYVQWQYTSFRTTKKQALRLERGRVEKAVKFWTGIAKKYLEKGRSYGHGQSEIQPDELPEIRRFITRKKKLIEKINHELKK